MDVRVSAGQRLADARDFGLARDRTHARKGPRDLSSLAKSIVDDATSEEPRSKLEEQLKNVKLTNA